MNKKELSNIIDFFLTSMFGDKYVALESYQHNIDKIKDQNVLKLLALSDFSWDIKEMALRKITDVSFLKYIAYSNPTNLNRWTTSFAFIAEEMLDKIPNSSKFIKEKN